MDFLVNRLDQGTGEACIATALLLTGVLPGFRRQDARTGPGS
jgi:hypothetical protein